MLATYIALTLAGGGDPNTEVVDPGTGMFIDNLTVATHNAGACPAPEAPIQIPTTDAVIELRWRTTNRDDDDYTVQVFLDEEGYPPSIIPLGTSIVPGYDYVNNWVQGYLAPNIGYGRLTMLGMIEDGPANRIVTEWKFRVVLTRDSDGYVVRTLSVPWRKTYGTCA
jgi:hypothetical protein